MEIIKEYIKTHIYQTNLYSIKQDELKVISSYSHFKLYYKSDFICYLDNDINNLNKNKQVYEFINHIENYIIKKNQIICLFCITNEDEFLINLALNNLNKIKQFKILIIGSNDKHIKQAILFNNDYIISIKKDYKLMIQTGLTYIRSNYIFKDFLFITNSDTLISPNIITFTINKFNDTFFFGGPTSIKYLNLNIVNLCLYNLSTSNLFFSNWFLISKNILNLLNWNLFEASTELNKILELHILKYKGKIFEINKEGTLCFNYEKEIKINSKKMDMIEEMEFKLLNMLINNKFIHFNKMDKFINIIKMKDNSINMNKISKIQEEQNNDFIEREILLKNYIIPKKKVIDSINEININIIDKFYIIRIFLNRDELEKKIHDISILNKSNYTIINNENRLKSHTIAIRDAITRKLSKICIIEDRLLTDYLLFSIQNNEIFQSAWDIVLLIPFDNEESKSIKINDLNTENMEIIDNIKIFAYCLNNNIYKKYLNLILKKETTLNKCILELYIYNFHIIQGNFNFNNLTINKSGKIIDEDYKKLQKQNNIMLNNSVISNMLIPIGKNYKQLKLMHPNIKDNRKSFAPSNNSDLSLNNYFPIKENQELIVKASGFQKNNKIIQSLCLNNKLNLNEFVCIMSFIKNGHEFHLYTYDQVENVPTECTIKNANEILQIDKFPLDKKNSNEAIFFNIFCYKLLYEKGNYWIKLDMICNQYFNFNELYIFSSEKTNHNTELINTKIIKCPLKSEFAKYCYNNSLGMNKIQNISIKDIEINIIDEAINKFKLGSFMKPWYYFCPIDKLNNLVDLSLLKIDPGWYSLNLNIDCWEKFNLDKNKIYHGSLFNDLVNKYCPNCFFLNDSYLNLE